MICTMTGVLAFTGHGFHSVLKTTGSEPSTGERGEADNPTGSEKSVASSSVRFLAAKCSAAGCKFTTENTSKLLGYLLQPWCSRS